MVKKLVASAMPAYSSRERISCERAKRSSAMDGASCELPLVAGAASR